jgi:hypothetical protein
MEATAEGQSSRRLKLLLLNGSYDHERAVRLRTGPQDFPVAGVSIWYDASYVDLSVSDCSSDVY